MPVHGVAQLVSNGTRAIAFIKHVRWAIFVRYVPLLVVGVAGATWVFRTYLEGEKLAWFKPFIGAFILAFLWWRRWKPLGRDAGNAAANWARNPPLWIYPVLGLVVGFLAIFVGATGPFIAPFFLRDDLNKEQVIATKASVQVVGHILKVPAFFAIGFDYTAHVEVLAVLCVGVVVGTFIGKWLLGKLPENTFVILFECVLAVLACYLITSYFVPSLGS